MTERAHVNPRVLRWAREASGSPLEKAAKKAGLTAARLEAAESGESLITMRQLELLAHFYQRSTPSFFMPEPPAESPVEARFRHIPGTPPPPWPEEVRGLIREMTLRQSTIKEVIETAELAPRWAQRPRLDPDGGAALASKIRHWLDVEVESQRGLDPYGSLRLWLDSAEAVGIFVSQSSRVDVNVMRGFALADEVAPLVLLNLGDDPRARAFTLIHETVHLLINSQSRDWQADEELCNATAASVLMPAESFRLEYAAAQQASSSLLDVVDRVARAFGTTPDATAVRTGRLDLARWEEIRRVRAAIGLRAPRSGRGGNYYRNVVARFGPAFIDTVFRAVDTGAISALGAARALDGTKIDKFPKLRAELAERAAR
ncbi:MAG: XRE family transcriptional regulator [Miltoncostaeaceae bacterium]